MINEYSQFILILKAFKHAISVNICFLEYGNPEKKALHLYPAIYIYCIWEEC